MKVSCYTCDKEFSKAPSEIKRSKSGKHFCCKSCATKENNKLRRGENHPNYRLGRGSYRMAKLRISDLTCEDCKNNDHRVLEVHHKDHDRDNNRLDNLIILCANCHKIRHYEEKNTCEPVVGKQSPKLLKD